MKLIIQIPCLNEVETLGSVIQSIPRNIPGIDIVETLVIDDGSTDGTSELARKIGVNHIIRNTVNRGLARSFQRGIDECLRRGADVIVNTDGDNQYRSEDIPKLVKPIIGGLADMVVGDRGGMSARHFSYFKRLLQVLGSYVIRKLTKLPVSDAVSGFRAFSRDAIQQINIISDFSYTIEMLIQAGSKKLTVISVPISTNKQTRESRLFKTIPQFLRLSITTLMRVYTMYSPLKVFLFIGICLFSSGAVSIARFMFYFMIGAGGGHVQSLVLGGTLSILGVVTLLFGIIADLVNFNRRLLERILSRMDKLEERMKAYDDAIIPHPHGRNLRCQVK